jgi:hypothetical protein
MNRNDQFDSFNFCMVWILSKKNLFDRIYTINSAKIIPVFSHIRLLSNHKDRIR